MSAAAAAADIGLQTSRSILRSTSAEGPLEHGVCSWFRLLDWPTPSHLQVRMGAVSRARLYEGLKHAKRLGFAKEIGDHAKPTQSIRRFWLEEANFILENPH